MSSKWRFWSIDDLANMPEPSWTLDGILPEAGAAVLYGRSGVGKSFLAIDWMLSVAGGHKWEGKAVHQGPVVYVCAENAYATHTRIAGWARLRGKPMPQSDVFILTPDPVLLAEPDAARDFLLALSQAQIPPPRLVVLDTLQRNMAGHDENSTKDMTMWVSGLQVLVEAFGRSTVLVVHHSGKDPTKGDRGSTVLRASVETVLELSGDRRTATLTCHKQKNGPEPRPLALAREGREQDGAFVFKTRGFDEFEEKVLAVIREHPTGLTMTALRKAMGGKDRVGLARLRRSLEALVSHDLVILDGTEFFPGGASDGPNPNTPPPSGAPSA